VLEDRRADGSGRPDRRDGGQEHVLGDGGEDLVRDTQRDPERDSEAAGRLRSSPSSLRTPVEPPLVTGGPRSLVGATSCSLRAPEHLMISVENLIGLMGGIVLVACLSYL
jgi:hypothetical protein